MTGTLRTLIGFSGFGIRISFGLCHSEFVITLVETPLGLRQERCSPTRFRKRKAAQPHQLIPSKSRKRPAHPHKQEDHDGNLCEKDCDVDQAEDPAAGASWYA